MKQLLFRVNVVARTSISVLAKTESEAEAEALDRLLSEDMDWEVESSEVVEILRKPDAEVSEE